MADVEKSSERSSTDRQELVVHERPQGLLGIYYHPYTQVCLLGFVVFMGPGLFNALNGLGGGGRVDTSTSANSNAAVYATFAFMAFFAGSINNKLGSRLTLFLGSTGYCLYVGSYLATNIHENAGPFIIAAGAVLGFCAGLLWTAQGSLMLAYPTEQQKGRFIAIFWSIFNLGGVVGAAVALALNIHNTGNSVGNGTYIAFLVLTLLGVALTLTMADPSKMVRTDGTKVTTTRHPTWKVEIKSLWVALASDPLILLLFPLFFASNWFYTWQFNCYNAALFNIGARSLNSLTYWLSQIVGSIAISVLLDAQKFKRRVRAYAGWVVLFVMVWVVHIWAYFYQRGYTRQSIPPESVKLGIGEPGYAAKIWLYILMGILDSMWQTYAYWLMGAMSNDPAKLAHFTGFYKSLQSAGAAGIWRADGQLLPYMNIFVSTWVLLVAGLLCALPMLYLRIKETTDLEDETLVRMDDQGHVQPVDEGQRSEKA